MQCTVVSVPPFEDRSLARADAKPGDDPKDSLHRYLEDVASSQPLSSKEEVSLARRIKKGDIILMAAFGGGLTWASALLRW